MSKINKRGILDIAIFIGCSGILTYQGAGFEAPIVLFIFGAWNFYDGATRKNLEEGNG